MLKDEEKCLYSKYTDMDWYRYANCLPESLLHIGIFFIRHHVDFSVNRYNYYITSYNLKHMLEDLTGRYVSNDQMKAIFIANGILPKDVGEVNWYFKIKVKPFVSDRGYKGLWDYKRQYAKELVELIEAYVNDDSIFPCSIADVIKKD